MSATGHRTLHTARRVDAKAVTVTGRYAFACR